VAFHLHTTHALMVWAELNLRLLNYSNTIMYCDLTNHNPVNKQDRKLLFNNQPDALINQIYSVIKLYMFRASSLPSFYSKFGTSCFCLHTVLYHIAAFVLYSFFLVFLYRYISFACLALTNFTFMLRCIVIDFFLNNQPDALIIQIYSVIKLHMFRAHSVPIISASAWLFKRSLLRFTVT
jgi:hypothetical protein